MKRKIPPAVVIASLILTLVVVFYYGFHNVMAEPRHAVGIKKDGTEMTEEDGRRMREAMSGAYSKSHPADAKSQPLDAKNQAADTKNKAADTNN